MILAFPANNFRRTGTGDGRPDQRSSAPSSTTSPFPLRFKTSVGAPTSAPSTSFSPPRRASKGHQLELQQILAVDRKGKSGGPLRPQSDAPPHNTLVKEVEALLGQPGESIRPSRPHVGQQISARAGEKDGQSPSDEGEVRATAWRPRS